MSVIIIVAFIWGMSAVVRAAAKAGEQRKAMRAYQERQRSQALQAARAAAAREEWKRLELARQEEWRQRQLEAKIETARLIALERGRMEKEKAERRALEQAQKDAERARKEAEKAHKAEFERQQAEADLEHMEAIRQGYMDLMDALEAEAAESTTTAKRRVTIQRQLLTLEEKLYKIDTKRAKAYYLVKGAC